ncbi:ABC transporter substrate-binding protein, partial [Pseudomonas protegens]|uniref:ABC transporter substrate-binding protein n=2 Tax=Pseudomonas TaxID=286 RepID=UPI00223BB863
MTLRSLLRSGLALTLFLGTAQAFAEATHYPLTITSCNREVTFKQAPQHALSHDINMTQMMLALGLKSRMVGYSGVSGWKAVTPQMSTLLDGLPELAAKYPSVETLLNANVDFLFAGWDYGMRVGGDLTPQTLAPLGINVYELTESCAFVMKRPAASLEDTYNDLRNLGRIFDVQDRANALIAQMQEQVAEVQKDLPKDPPRVFLYDSGEDRAMTSGRLGMPQALIDAAGGRNILDDVEASWTRINWETVVERNPQVIVIVDYSEVTAEQKQQFLL